MKMHEVDTILDVGANVGNHSLPFSLYAENVWSFKPSPKNFERLHRNISLNRASNIKAINLGISDRDRKAVFYYNTSKNSGLQLFERRAS